MGFLVLAFLLAIYAMPTVIAYRRNHKNRMAICATNLLLGWTVLGWVAALIWSLTASE